MTCRCNREERQLTQELDDYFAGLEEEINRNSRSYIAWVQRSLNRIIAAGLAEDGVSGKLTRSAVSRFQQRAGLSADGIVGTKTEAALVRAGATSPPQSGSSTSSPIAPAISGGSSGALAPTSGGSSTTTDLASVRANAVRIAKEEYDRWRPGGSMLTESSSAAKPFLQRYWTEGVGQSPSAASSAISSDTPWSAAFISWVMKTAGAGKEFSYSSCHATYIKAAKDNRLNGSSNPFKAYRVTEIAPRLGDLVCKCRESCVANYDTVDTRGGCMPTHCDVVVEIGSGSIRTIGGNLSDSVGSTVVTTDGEGRVNTKNYFAVIRVGDDTGGASATTQSSSSTGTPSATAGSTGFVRGTNAFGQLFQSTATGQSNSNAYLLAYLSTLMYVDYGLVDLIPEFASQTAEERGKLEYRLQSDDASFKEQFERLTRPFFYDAARPSTNSPPRYQFRTAGARTGDLASLGLVRDPEAMVVGTSYAVFVVFRGTDRVGTADLASEGYLARVGYEVGEWLSTNFLVQGTSPGGSMRGKVHSGMWKSLALIKDQLAEDVIAFGGRSKPVWVTGHSLGAAQALLFSIWLAAQHGIRPMGTYAFAAPRVGDREFMAYANQVFPKASLQRFDFVSDPVTMVAPRRSEIPVWMAAASFNEVPDYYHPGIRNYYDDVYHYAYNTSERASTEFGDTVRKGVTSLCFHYPQWYLVGAYRQLTESQRAIVPAPVALPNRDSLACNTEVIARGLKATG